MKLVERYEQSIHQGLHGWAGEHAAAYPDLFKLLDIDTVRYPNQHVNIRSVSGVPLDAGAIDSIAYNLDPRYEGISNSIDSDKDGLMRIGELLDAGENVIVGTGHGELIDIAFIMAKLRSSIEQLGYNFESGIIVNAIVKYLAVKMNGGDVEALNVLGYAVNETFVNLPSTTSGKEKLMIPRRVITAHNNSMVNHAITKRLMSTGRKIRGSKDKVPPLLLGIALSGTTEKSLDVDAYNKKIKEEGEESVLWIPEEERARTMVSGRVSKSLTRITQHGFTVPTASNLTPGLICVSMSGIPLYIQTEGKLDTAMQTINDMESRTDLKHYHVYDKIGNLPVRRTVEIGDSTKAK